MTVRLKVKILTHRLGPNYGGILQAYALQKYIVDTFKDVDSVRTGHMHPDHSPLRRFISTIGGSLKRRRLYVNTSAIHKTICRNTLEFTREHIKTIDMSRDEPDERTDLYIVGSDQVWRASHISPIRYLFGFINNDNVRRISYAASFGRDDLSEYSQKEINITTNLAKKFGGISVRESSGVSLAKKYWGVSAIQHVDPTLLLMAEDYNALIEQSQLPAITARGGVFAYILDRDSLKVSIVERVSRYLSVVSFELLPKQYNSYFNYIRYKEKYIMPPVEEWLRSFRDADFVVTDSFHGVVFSIVYNKPFLAVGNKERGLARFTSLLRLFGLEDRLVLSGDDISEELIRAPIDWQRVNAIKERERQRSYRYLMKYLSTSPKG